MKTITTRLDELEAALQPGGDPLLVLYQQDGITYTTAPTRPEARIIPPAELAELERTHQLIIIEYVDNLDYGPESDI